MKEPSNHIQSSNKRPFRVAIVGGCLSSHGGGAPRSMAQQARALTNKGCAVTLFAGQSSCYPFTPDQLGIQHIPSHTSQLWGPSVLGLFPKALYRLWKEAPELDVIHLNGAWNLTTFIGGRIAHLRKTPYIISCRSHYGDYHFSRMPLLKKVLFLLLEKKSIRHAYALHVTAEWEEKTSWRAAQEAHKIITIPNPVNLTDFENPPSRSESRQHLGLQPDGFYIVHLGRLGKQKNLPFLLKAFHQADLGTDAHLVLVGPPEQHEKDRLKKLAASLNMEKQLRFVDFAQGRERCHWLAAANLFALPSHDENFCIAAIESVAAGTPCLLSPFIGAVEYLPKHSVNICSVNEKEWADAISEAYQTRPASLQPESEEPLDYLFSLDSITHKWLLVYEQIRAKQ